MIEENQTFDVEQKLNDAITCIDSMQYEQAIRLCDECITYLEATKRQNSNKERLNKRDSLVKQKSLKKNTSTTSMSSIFTSSIKSSLLRKRDDSTSETNDSISETNDSTPEIDKQLAKAYFHRNLAKNLLHRDYITVIDFTKAIDLFSQYVNAYLNRARAYYKLKNFEAALDDLNKAIEYDPKNFKAYYYRGKVYYGLERYKEARTDFLETRNLDPEFKKVYRHLIMTLYCLDLDETALAEATDAIRLYPELKKDLEKQHLKSVQEKINRQTFSNQLIIGKLTYKTSGLNTKLRLKKDDLLRQQSTSSKLFIKKMKKSDTRFFQKMLDQPTSKFPGLCLIHIKDTFSAEEVEKLEEQQVILSLPHLKEALENPDSWKQRYYLKYLKAGIEQLLLAWTGNNLKNESVVFTLDEMALPQLKILLENTKTSSSKTRKIYKELQKNHSQDEALKNILNAWKKGEVKDKKITTDSLLPSYKTNLDELKKALTPLNDALNFKQASSSKHKKNKHHKQTQHKSESPATKTDYDSTLLKIRLITQRPPEHLKKQDYNNLIRDLTSLIMRNEGKAEVYYLLASTYTRIKEHGLALANYDKAYELRTDGTLSTDTEGKLLANRGFTKYCLNDYVGAERDYQNSIEINKNDFYVHSNLGALYHKLGRYGEALKEYNSAIKLNSAVFLLCRRGLTYICLGIYDKALADFSEALKDLDPKHPKYFDSLINKSIAERNLGLYEDAITTLKIAIKQNPKSADAYWHLGLVYESFK
ncbi:MAG: tetratricopeptide repeat protein, partial [Proteobacteria bacterium]|nr:tetratricopeptide repeat protein [Pseudomonadota bacterium]